MAAPEITLNSTVTTKSDVSQALDAVETTVADPSVLNVLHDLQLAHSIYADVKAKLADLHNTNQNRIIAILQAIF